MSRAARRPALTALAVISMLAHGDDPNFGPYSKTVHQGLDYLIKGHGPDDRLHWAVDV